MILFFNTSLCLAAVCLIIQSRREDTANFELYVAHQFSKSFFNNKVTSTNHSKCMWQVTSALCTYTRERKITYQFQFLSLRITSQYIFFHISIVPLIFILCLLQKLLFFLLHRLPGSCSLRGQRLQRNPQKQETRLPLSVLKHQNLFPFYKK